MEAHFKDEELNSFTPSPSFPRTPKIFDRFDSSSSSDEDFSPSSSSYTLQNPNSTTTSNSNVKSAAKKLDYMIQFLDRKLSKANSNNGGNNNNNNNNSPLPEFIGFGGGTEMFKLLVRSAVRPDQPPSVEIRPYPRRETQVGRGLGLIISTDKQLWGGGDCSDRCWELSDVFTTRDDDDDGGGGCGCEDGADCLCSSAARAGDEMTARFRESKEVVCMVADEGERVVWSGLRWGKWEMGD